MISSEIEPGDTQAGRRRRHLPEHKRTQVNGAPKSTLHRLRPGTKILGMLLFGIMVVAVPGWLPALAFLGVGLALTLISGMSGRTLALALRGFALVGALLFGFQLWQHSLERATEVVAGLLALICAASAVTASTAVSDMLDTITWSLHPLRRFGVSPERAALAFSIAIRSIPQASIIARETLQAAHARGLKRDPRAFVVPFAVRMVAYARDTGAALHARGLGDDHDSR